MMMQLVASGRGVAALPNWALTEYQQKGYVVTKPLGAQSCWAILYAAIRVEQMGMTYVQEFLADAKASSLAQLQGIRLVQ